MRPPPIWGSPPALSRSRRPLPRCGPTGAQRRSWIEQVKAGDKQLDPELREQSETRAKLGGREEQLLANQAGEQARRDAAVAAFWRFTATGLLAVALPELDQPGMTGMPAREPADLEGSEPGMR